MKLDVRVHRLARAEIADAGDWHEEQRTGGRAAFLADLRRTMEQIRELPESGAAYPDDRVSARRVIVHGWTKCS